MDIKSIHRKQCRAMIIKPKNWIDFQHYKDRCPPWIKLHKSILDNYDFQMLPDASKALAMCLWLVASEHLDGEIDADFTKLAFRLRQSAEKIEKALKPLIDYGFFLILQDAINPLAECKQDAPLDRGETETERDTPQAASTSKKPSRKKPTKTTIPDGFTVSDSVKAWANANGHSRLVERLSHFTNACKAKGYEYADWDAAFRNAISNDWAKLGKPETPANPTYRAKTQAEMDAEKEQRMVVMEERKRKILAMPVEPNPWEVGHV